MSIQSTINLGASKGRRALDRVQGFITGVGPGLTFTGTFSGEGNCVVMGTVHGICRLDGTLVIGEQGHWVGDIEATNVLIAGHVEGNVRAGEKMEVVSTARVKGSLHSPVIAIAEGAVYEGEMHMSSKAAVVRFVEQRSVPARADAAE